MSPDQSVTREVAMEAKAWPFEEARKLLGRAEKRPSDEPLIFRPGTGQAACRT